MNGTATDVKTLSASSIIGDKVANMDNQTLGDVKDLMLDLERGQIAYAVLETGDFLGMGGKYFAIPWNALRVDGDDKQLVLNANKEQFENAEGFDKNNWPDFANATFGERAHRAFGQEHYANR